MKKREPLDDFNSYQDLPVWQKALELSVAIYEEVKSIPEDDGGVIVQQICNAAIRVPARIADGHGRVRKEEQAECFGQSRGALFELETCVIICEQLEYWSKETAENLLSQSARICKMLDGIISKIDSK